LAFLKQPNDMFSSLHSITQIETNRSPKIDVVQAGCDYFTYFRSEAGLEALSKALGKGR
jgi:hypothetical protein